MIASGTEPAASMIVGGTVAVTNRGTYIPGFLFDRGFEAGWMTTLAIFLVIAGSLAVHLTLNARARRVQEATGVRPTTWWKSLIVLFAPLVLVLWALGFHLDIPQPPTRFNFEGGVVVQNPFVAMLIALSLYTGAFIAEIVRAGIQSVSRGQTEAAFALGLRPNRTMNLVILPQALRVIIPPLISQFLNLTKNTSLGIAASYADLRGTLGGGHAEPDRARGRGDASDDADLSVDQPDHLVADERLQPLCPAEGALRCPTHSSVPR